MDKAGLLLGYEHLFGRGSNYSNMQMQCIDLISFLVIFPVLL